MAGLLRGNLLEEMSLWISGTVDDTCIPLAAADQDNVLVQIYSEWSLSVWAEWGRVKQAVMSQKWMRQVAEPAAYQHLTKAISDCYNSHEGAVWFPPGELRQEREESCWKAIKERSIGSAAFGSSAEQSLLLLQHWRWGCSSPECSPGFRKWDSWSSSWALELFLFLWLSAVPEIGWNGAKCLTSTDTCSTIWTVFLIVELLICNAISNN